MSQRHGKDHMCFGLRVFSHTPLHQRTATAAGERLRGRGALSRAFKKPRGPTGRVLKALNIAAPWLGVRNEQLPAIKVRGNAVAVGDP